MAEAKKKQTMRFSDPELSVMKAVFAENDPLIFSIRKVFLQVELTKEEKETLKFLNKDAVGVLRKYFLPEIDSSAPLFQLVDEYTILGNEIKDKPLYDFNVYVKSKEIVIDYLKQQFTVFENDVPRTSIRLIDLVNTRGVPLAEMNEMYVKVAARNYILQYVDSQLNQIVFLSGLKNETVEQTISRLQKNSTK